LESKFGALDQETMQFAREVTNTYRLVQGDQNSAFIDIVFPQGDEKEATAFQNYFLEISRQSKSILENLRNSNSSLK
jgi:hypothetical protein